VTAVVRSFNITKILITHGHPDHVAGLAHTKKAIPGAEICIHPLDVETLRAATAIGSVREHATFRRGMTTGAPFHDGGSVLSLFQQVFSLTIPELPEPDTLVEDNDVLHVGNLRLRAIHTPGARDTLSSLLLPPARFSFNTRYRQATLLATCVSTSPAKISFSPAICSSAVPSAALVWAMPMVCGSCPLSSSALQSADSPPSPPDLPGADSKVLGASLQKILREVPDRNTHVFPGHMQPTVLADECKGNFFLAPLATKLDRQTKN
jgi:glyoxylase-like metal-dependent hydrolase (beta-lactamase superfamily II)